MSENGILRLLPQVHFPGVVYVGKNALFYFKTLKNEKVLTLVSQSVWEHHNEILKRSLPDCDFRFCHGEPTQLAVKELHATIKERGYTHVIGVGGGSVMDLAKTARLADENVKTILVPTTSGTGAEVSRNAVITEGSEKKPIVSEKLVPHTGILYPHFTLTLPLFETTYIMVDALTHSIEGLASRTSNPLTESIALFAIDIIIPHLKKARENANDLVSRERLQLAGFLSGFVQSSSSVGLIHSFANYFGTKMKLPHGLAVALFTIPVLTYGMKKTDQYQKLQASRHLHGDVIANLKEFMCHIGLYDYHTKLNFGNVDIKEACEWIRNDACTTTNPYPVSDDDVKNILSSMGVI